MIEGSTGTSLKTNACATSRKPNNKIRTHNFVNNDNTDYKIAIRPGEMLGCIILISVITNIYKTDI